MRRNFKGRQEAMLTRPLIQGAAFEPELIAAMSEALEAACKELQDGGRLEVVREAIAIRIIAAARAGERDPVRLQAASCRGLPMGCK
jgi:hypothetical protein